MPENTEIMIDQYVWMVVETSHFLDGQNRRMNRQVVLSSPGVWLDRAGAEARASEYNKGVQEHFTRQQSELEEWERQDEMNDWWLADHYESTFSVTNVKVNDE